MGMANNEGWPIRVRAAGQMRVGHHEGWHARVAQDEGSLADWPALERGLARMNADRNKVRVGQSEGYVATVRVGKGHDHA